MQGLYECVEAGLCVGKTHISSEDVGSQGGSPPPENAIGGAG